MAPRTKKSKTKKPKAKDDKPKREQPRKSQLELAQEFFRLTDRMGKGRLDAFGMQPRCSHVGWLLGEDFVSDYIWKACGLIQIQRLSKNHMSDASRADGIEELFSCDRFIAMAMKYTAREYMELKCKFFKDWAASVGADGRPTKTRAKWIKYGERLKKHHRDKKAERLLLLWDVFGLLDSSHWRYIYAEDRGIVIPYYDYDTVYLSPWDTAPFAYDYNLGDKHASDYNSEADGPEGDSEQDKTSSAGTHKSLPHIAVASTSMHDESQRDASGSLLLSAGSTSDSSTNGSESDDSTTDQHVPLPGEEGFWEPFTFREFNTQYNRLTADPRFNLPMGDERREYAVYETKMLDLRLDEYIKSLHQRSVLASTAVTNNINNRDASSILPLREPINPAFLPSDDFVKSLEDSEADFYKTHSFSFRNVSTNNGIAQNRSYGNSSSHNQPSGPSTNAHAAGRATSTAAHPIFSTSHREWKQLLKIIATNDEDDVFGLRTPLFEGVAPLSQILAQDNRSNTPSGNASSRAIAGRNVESRRPNSLSNNVSMGSAVAQIPIAGNTRPRNGSSQTAQQSVFANNGKQQVFFGQQNSLAQQPFTFSSNGRQSQSFTFSDITQYQSTSIQHWSGNQGMTQSAVNNTYTTPFNSDRAPVFNPPASINATAQPRLNPNITHRAPTQQNSRNWTSGPPAPTSAPTYASGSMGSINRRLTRPLRQAPVRPVTQAPLRPINPMSIPGIWVAGRDPHNFGASSDEGE